MSDDSAAAAVAAAEDLRLQGNASFEKGELEASEAHYTAALAAESAIPAGDGATEIPEATVTARQQVRKLALGNRSLVRCKLNKPEEALQDAEASLKVDINYVKAHDRKASAYLALGKAWQARKTYEDAVKYFEENNRVGELPYLRKKLEELKKQCQDLDATQPVESLEHWQQIAVNLPMTKEPRIRLCTMATFWNTATPSDRQSVFQKFIEILNGSSQILSDLEIPEDTLVELPMDNYADVVVPNSWVEFFKACSVEDKIAVFQGLWDLCSPNECTMILHDLGEFFPKP
mmetsp:Transcript_9527/g.16701  ORF Transcript_9527/g.16701 Transcript_9527/m.16701 type:complete len:290 (+) Transcript_9527:46-915(+)